MSDEVKYNSFPLGQIPVHLQRPELHLLKALGKYTWNDDREVIDIFEKKVAEFWGAKYAVSTDSCTSSIELSFKYLLYTNKINYGTIIKVPARTYVSAVQVLDKVGLTYDIEDIEWKGFYQYKNTPVIDSAVYWQKDGYMKNTLMCLSFQQKKFIPISKMGCILCDDYDTYKTLKLMSYDGRDLKSAYTSKQHVSSEIPWKYLCHAYSTPEDCSRGIILLDEKTESIGAYGGSENYPDIRIWGS